MSEYIKPDLPEPASGTRLVSLRTADAVYIGRGGQGEAGAYGNWIRLGEPCGVCLTVHVDRSDTINCFEKSMRARLAFDPTFREAVCSLRDKPLWCPGCRGRRPCHGEVYIRWLKENP